MEWGPCPVAIAARSAGAAREAQSHRASLPSLSDSDSEGEVYLSIFKFKTSYYAKTREYPQTNVELIYTTVIFIYLCVSDIHIAAFK